MINLCCVFLHGMSKWSKMKDGHFSMSSGTDPEHWNCCEMIHDDDSLKLTTRRNKTIFFFFVILLSLKFSFVERITDEWISLIFMYYVRVLNKIHILKHLSTLESENITCISSISI